MCTLTYIPIESGGKIITANRDESPLRSAHQLSKYRSNGNNTYYIAKEPRKGGTNIAIAVDGRVSVLLNGAFKPHKMGGDYVKSRGILLLESLDYENVFAFAENSFLNGIEPFTLVDFQDVIREIRWDGKKVYKKSFKIGEPLIWASAQLYSEDVREKRKKWFSELLSNEPNQDDVLEFHFHGGDGDPANDLVMNRSGLVQTVSITQLVKSGDDGLIQHFDLVGSTDQSIRI